MLLRGLNEATHRFIFPVGSINSYLLYALAHVLLGDQLENLKPYVALFKETKSEK